MISLPELPEGAPSQSLSIDVTLTDYQVSIPKACETSCASATFTKFCAISACKNASQSCNSAALWARAFSEGQKALISLCQPALTRLKTHMVFRHCLSFVLCFASCADEAQAPAMSIAATIPIVFNPCMATPAAIWRSGRLTHAPAALLKTVRIAQSLQESTHYDAAALRGTGPMISCHFSTNPGQP